jgi:hypothetical protein
MDFFHVTSWIMRGAFVAFTMVSWAVFCKLWTAYQHDRTKAKLECECCSYNVSHVHVLHSTRRMTHMLSRAAFSLQGVRFTFLFACFAFMVLTIFAGFGHEKWRDYLWDALA